MATSTHPAFLPLHAQLCAEPQLAALPADLHSLLALYPARIESYLPTLTAFYTAEPELLEAADSSTGTLSRGLGQVEVSLTRSYPEGERRAYATDRKDQLALATVAAEALVEELVGDDAQGSHNLAAALAYQYRTIVRCMLLLRRWNEGAYRAAVQLEPDAFHLGLVELTGFFGFDMPELARLALD